MPREATILLAGYGWFSGIPEGEINNAELVARALDGEILEVTGPDGASVRGHVHSLILPVAWDEAFPCIEAEIARLRPDVVVAMGTDARISGIRPEPYGINWQRGVDALPDDPQRQTEKCGPILPGGAPYLRGTLPYEDMVLSILAAGVPALLGHLLPPEEGVPLPAYATPGAYLCNKMTYLLAAYGQRTGVPAGFLHLPTQPGYAAARRLARLASLTGEARSAAMERPISAMPLEMMVRGVRAALHACLAAR